MTFCPAATTVRFDKGKLEKGATGLGPTRNSWRMQLDRGDTAKLQSERFCMTELQGQDIP